MSDEENEHSAEDSEQSDEQPVRSEETSEQSPEQSDTQQVEEAQKSAEQSGEQPTDESEQSTEQPDQSAESDQAADGSSKSEDDSDQAATSESGTDTVALADAGGGGEGGGSGTVSGGGPAVVDPFPVVNSIGFSAPDASLATCINAASQDPNVKDLCTGVIDLTGLGANAATLPYVGHNDSERLYVGSHCKNLPVASGVRASPARHFAGERHDFRPGSVDIDSRMANEGIRHHTESVAAATRCEVPGVAEGHTSEFLQDFGIGSRWHRQLP
jgi:hypothetical protein